METFSIEKGYWKHTLRGVFRTYTSMETGLQAFQYKITDRSLRIVSLYSSSICRALLATTIKCSYVKSQICSFFVIMRYLFGILTFQTCVSIATRRLILLFNTLCIVNNFLGSICVVLPDENIHNFVLRWTTVPTHKHL